MSTPNPTWYDILGVGRDATPDEIKAAWRHATDKFEPGSGSGQFRLFNEAADVLLDPTRRREYDATLGAPTPPAPDSTPVPASEQTSGQTSGQISGPVVLQKSDEPAPPPGVGGATPPTHTPSTGRGTLPVVLLACTVLAVIAALVGGILFAVKASHEDVGVLSALRQGTTVADDDAGDEASATANRALVAVLGYDYRHMTADRDRAMKFLTSKYAKSYKSTFDKLLVESADGQPGNAAKTKTVVKASVLDVAVMDASPKRVRVLAYVNQVSQKGDRAPVVFQNRVAATLVKVGNTWLIDALTSY